MSIVNDPIDEDENREIENAYGFENEYPQLTSAVYFLLLFVGAILLVLLL
jgi:hypothetical protein